MASSPPIEKLTNEIFSILENKFLFGSNDHINTTTAAQAHGRGKVRILSIDAGDGILAAATLLHLQSILRRKSGNPSAHISDFFDVVSGAGAGGVLAGLLFTRGRDGRPMFSSEESLKFIVGNHGKLTAQYHSSSVFGRRWGPGRARLKVLERVFGDSTLRDTVKAVLIPCYDLSSGAPFMFSRADAVEMEGCDFRMAEVCGATVADRAVEMRSTDGRKKIVAVGGGVSNPTAAAITHVLNNKQEFPMCKGVEDLLVVSLGNVGAEVDFNHATSLLKIAADGAADMVDQAVSMAFGEWRTSNYVRIQGNGFGSKNIRSEKDMMKNMFGKNNVVDETLGQKNVESILFKGKKVVEYTNMEKVEMMAAELIKEKERRKYNSMMVLPTGIFNSPTPTATSSSSAASTPSTLSSSTT